VTDAELVAADAAAAARAGVVYCKGNTYSSAFWMAESIKMLAD
jgi:hypothetical protein